MKKLIFHLFISFISLTELFSQRLPDLIPYRKGNLWGYCDSTKRIIIEPKYKSVELFGEGIARVIFDDKTYGSIDTSGAIRIKYHIRDTFISDFHHGLAVIYRHRWRKFKSGFVDKNFKVVIPLIYDVDDEEFPMEFWNLYSRITYHGKQGLIDTSGKIILTPSRKIRLIYEWGSEFVELELKNDKMLIYDVNKKKVVLDASLLNVEEIKDTLIKFGYDSLKIERLFNSFSDTSSLNLKHEQQGYMDKYGTKYWDD